MPYPLTFQLAVLGTVLCAGSICLAQGQGSPAAPSSEPASQSASAPASQPAVDPFDNLKVVVPIKSLAPIRTLRQRDKREQADRSRKGDITVSINSAPKGATVLYGGKVLGKTPLSVRAKRGSTPLDVTLKSGGYMILRTRIRRKKNRSYFFKLTPAKIR